MSPVRVVRARVCFAGIKRPARLLASKLRAAAGVTEAAAATTAATAAAAAAAAPAAVADERVSNCETWKNPLSAGLWDYAIQPGLDTQLATEV
jgi:hypothetical protein